MTSQAMNTLKHDIQIYQNLLKEGSIQRAYRGIMNTMSQIKSQLGERHPDYHAGSLYFGYMDMTYFAFTPPDLRDRQLKIAIVYLHERNCFEIWLAGVNKNVQKKTVDWLKQFQFEGYSISEGRAGVDSIIESALVEQPDFDHPDRLVSQIDQGIKTFVENILLFLQSSV